MEKWKLENLLPLPSVEFRRTYGTTDICISIFGILFRMEFIVSCDGRSEGRTKKSKPNRHCIGFDFISSSSPIFFCSHVQLPHALKLYRYAYSYIIYHLHTPGWIGSHTCSISLSLHPSSFCSYCWFDADIVRPILCDWLTLKLKIYASEQSSWILFFYRHRLQCSLLGSGRNQITSLICQMNAESAMLIFQQNVMRWISLFFWQP